MAENFDTASAHQYDSWKDGDLYRAIETPENPPGPKRDAEIAEYVHELRLREERRAEDARRRAAINAIYGLGARSAESA